MCGCFWRGQSGLALNARHDRRQLVCPLVDIHSGIQASGYIQPQLRIYASAEVLLSDRVAGVKESIEIEHLIGCCQTTSVGTFGAQK